MRKVVKGICPKLNREVSIDVEYHKAHNLSKISYVKGRFSCDYADIVNCSGNNCPLYEKVPQNI